MPFTHLAKPPRQKQQASREQQRATSAIANATKDTSVHSFTVVEAVVATSITCHPHLSHFFYFSSQATLPYSGSVKANQQAVYVSMSPFLEALVLTPRLSVGHSYMDSTQGA